MSQRAGKILWIVEVFFRTIGGRPLKSHKFLTEKGSRVYDTIKPFIECIQGKLIRFSYNNNEHNLRNHDNGMNE